MQCSLLLVDLFGMRYDFYHCLSLKDSSSIWLFVYSSRFILFVCFKFYEQNKDYASENLASGIFWKSLFSSVESVKSLTVESVYASPVVS